MGILTLVPTPIGNLEDITLRALRSLKEADAVYCEDTRESKKLLSYYKINTPLFSYHKFNEQERVEEILGKLALGEQLCLISDQGMPGISDPGRIVLKAARKAGYTVTVLPGACALINAVVLSALADPAFTFLGFVPKKNKEKERFWARIEQAQEPLVCYEAVHRLPDTIEELSSRFPGRRAAIVREISKMYEECLEGTFSELSDIIKRRTLKGEFVIVIDAAEPQDYDMKDILREVENCISEGTKPSSAIKKIAKQIGYSKNEIYEAYLAQSANREEDEHE